MSLLPAACTPLQVEARQLDKRERIKKRHQVIRKKVSGSGNIGFACFIRAPCVPQAPTDSCCCRLRASQSGPGWRCTGQTITSMCRCV